MELLKTYRFGAVFLLIVLLLPQVMLQHLYYPQPRPLYYDAPRLRRFEYAAATPLFSGAAPPPPAHYQQQAPHFQVFNYRSGYQPLALDYQQQQPPVAPAPPLYPQQTVQYQHRVVSPPAELAKYRYEGNYLPVQRLAVQPQRRVEEQQQQQQQQQLQLQQQQQQQQHLYNVPPALFTSDVLHVIPPRIARLQEQQQQPSQTVQTERPRRFANKQDTEVAESRSDRNVKETNFFHDIFMRFDGPDSRSHGHVMKHPKTQERRFESQRGTNRYKGEVIWTDRQGGHGEHRWDMAQGKL
ncbi:uncharacterized protein Dana_GF10153 [Drosophila ananassae]|uniref:Uncharacterized protein n=1 Tax=Drosophila ananassae TaxID=7217 RepID=B3M677_DROAN|nr:nuclear transcription factor Y subunit beta [Drosophila ananassae]EDV39697.2 uncharacterized protein Dana_GF10153 [Drosophila ananassae]